MVYTSGHRNKAYWWCLAMLTCVKCILLAMLALCWLRLLVCTHVIPPPALDCAETNNVDVAYENPVNNKSLHELENAWLVGGRPYLIPDFLHNQMPLDDIVISHLSKSESQASVRQTCLTRELCVQPSWASSADSAFWTNAAGQDCSEVGVERHVN